MRAARRLAVLALLLLLVFGWRFLGGREATGARGAGPGPPPPEAVAEAPAAPVAAAGVRGTVRNVRGARVEGAVVALVDDDRAIHARDALAAEGRIASSDAEGAFEVAWPETLAAGVLSVRHPGYVARTLALPSVPPGPLDIVLEEGQRLAGEVAFLDKTPAPGVRVVARGIRAPYAAAREGSVPPAVAAFQESITDEQGRFELDGLPAGWYQIDVVAPGIAVVPEGTAVFPPWIAGDPRYLQEIGLHGPRGVVARMGDGPLRIHVAFIASIAVRAVDAATGHAIPGAHVSPSIPDGLERLFESPVSNNSEVMLVNGRTYSIHEGDLPQGTDARFLLSRSRAPAPDARCTVKATARGYEEQERDIPIHPLGTTDSVPVHDIALASPETTGGLRLHLRDRNGVPVCHACALVLQRAWGRETVAAFRFDALGNGDPVALPVGEYSVRAAAGPEWTPIEPAEAVVSEGTVSDVTLTLRDWAGFAITVVDEQDAPVDDFGVTASAGHEPVEPGVINKGDSVVIRGKFPALVPGLGPSWRGQIAGYREGPVTIEVVRHGYRPCRILADARAGEIVPIRAVLAADPDAPWGPR